jgi:hypothetical protein
MKTLLFILVIFLASCSMGKVTPIENPQKATTLEILNAVDTTNNYTFAIVNKKAYILENNIVKYETVSIETDYISIHFFFFAILITCFVLLIVILLSKIFKN